MFERVLPLLLSGEFVCQISHPEAFLYLSSEKNAQEVSSYLAKMKLTLSTTPQQSAFYLTYQQLDDTNRKSCKEEFTSIKQQLRPLVHFMELLMRVTRNDEILSVGAVLEKHALMAKVDDSHDLSHQLDTIANQFAGIYDKTKSGRLDKIFRRLEKEGYVVLANPEREIYQITGKIEYLQDIIAFLMEHEGIEEQEEQLETGTLW